MDQLKMQLDLILAERVWDIAGAIRGQDFTDTRISQMEDYEKSKRAEKSWYDQHPISDYIPQALKRLQEIDRQIQALLSQRA